MGGSRALVLLACRSGMAAALKLGDPPCSSSWVLPRRAWVTSAAAAAMASAVPPALSSSSSSSSRGDDDASSIGVLRSASFEFDYPVSFAVASKPIKTHLEEALVKDGKRQIGVVVDRVKIERLDEFGTPAFVGERVVQAELGRDGVTGARLVEATTLDDGSYRIEYLNESTRGDNHFVARIKVANGRLYVMTAQARTDDFDAARPSLQVGLDSFRLLPAGL